MVIVHVHVHVKPEHVDAFVAATIANAEQSLLEPGVLRFDVVRDATSPARFVLVEVYRTAEAPAAHKATPHYLLWRDTVEPMMAEPRKGVRYEPIHPREDTGWRTDVAASRPT